MNRPALTIVRALSLLAAATLATPGGAAENRARLLNLEEVVSADDYPKVAQANGLEGTVIVDLKLDRDGLVTSCRIKQSSGHVALDEQSCALFRARARFEPATDGRGRPIASSYERMLVWRLEGTREPPLPRQAWRARVSLAVDDQGNIVDCAFDAVGLPSAASFCPGQDADAKNAAGAERPAVRGEAQRIIETHFLPVTAAKAIVPPNRADANKVGQQVSEVVIDADGRVSDCTAISFSGAAGPADDHCKVIYTMHFEAGGPAPMTGTIVVTAYLRRQTAT